jgi:two-component system sensor histidine kinase AgrC
MGLTSSISASFLSQAGSMIYMAIFVAMILFVFMFFYKFSFLKSIGAMCIVFFLKAIVSTMCLPIYKLLIRNNFNATNATLIERLIAQMLGIVFLLLIVMVIFLFKIKVSIPKDLNKKRALTIVINLVVSLLLLFPNLIHIQDHMDTRSTPLLVYNSISLVLIIAINTFNFIRFGKIEFLKQNLEFQDLYIKSLNEMIDSLRGFRHDHNNMLQVMSGYISANDMDGLRNFHEQLLSESRKTNNIAPLNSYIKDNPPIYGLLLSKISYAEIKNVPFTITVLCKLEVPSIKIYDLCKVLGVLLDNAIEAAVDSEKKFAELSIRENADKSCLFIEINNSCVGIVDTEAIFKDGYTSKKGHTGFGLWEVKKIIARYKNCKLHTCARQNSFSQKIEIMY